MHGTVLWWYPDVPSPNSIPSITLGVQEYAFWHWRVATIKVDYSYQSAVAGPFAGNYGFAKTRAYDAITPAYDSPPFTDERSLVTGNSYTVPIDEGLWVGWRSAFTPPPGNYTPAITWAEGLSNLSGLLNDTGIFATMGDLAYGIAQATPTPSGVFLTVAGTDIITGITYTRQVELTYDAALVSNPPYSGYINITPVTYYEYDGRYNPATGALV